MNASTMFNTRALRYNRMDAAESRWGGRIHRLLGFAGGAAGVLGLLGAAAPAQADDFSVSVRIGDVCPPAPCPPPVPVVTRTVVVHEPVNDYYCYAGTLTIDGRDFVIETGRNIASQFVEAFQCMGYWASSDGWNVRVNKSLSGPNICWRSGDYCLDISKDSDQIFLKPSTRATTWVVDYDWSWDWNHGCYRDITHRYRYCSTWWEPRYHRGYSFFFHIGDSDRHDHDHHRRDRHGHHDRWDWRDHDRHDRDHHGRRDWDRDRDGRERFDGRGNDRGDRDNHGRGDNGRDERDTDDAIGARNPMNPSGRDFGPSPTVKRPTTPSANPRGSSGNGRGNDSAQRPDRTGGRDRGGNADGGGTIGARNPMNPSGRDRGPSPTVNRPSDNNRDSGARGLTGRGERNERSGDRGSRSGGGGNRGGKNGGERSKR